MKKIFALILALCLVSSFALAESHLIGYSLNSMDSTMKTMADYFEGVAKDRGWEPVLLNANGDVSTEMNNMERFRFFCSWSKSSRICPWIVTSRADTGSSAITNREPAIRASAILTLCF